MSTATTPPLPAAAPDPLDAWLADLAAMPVEPDPARDWMNTHPEELARYRGRRVAIDPARGVIASGADIGEVIDQLDQMGIPRESDDVLLTVVPA